MKDLTIIKVLFGFTIAIALFHFGKIHSEDKLNPMIEIQDELINVQYDLIDSLKIDLKVSNEKRGRLYLALMYKDLKTHQSELDSLIYLIGKDN